MCKLCSLQNEHLQEFHHSNTWIGSCLQAAISKMKYRLNEHQLLSGGFTAEAFQNKHLHLHTKVAVYEAVCISALLYSKKSGSLAPTSILKGLECFHVLKDA